MTTFSIAVPASWSSAVRDAVASWPPGVDADVTPRAPGAAPDPAVVRITAATTYEPALSAPPSLRPAASGEEPALLADARVVGEREMRPERFSAFARRTVGTAVDPERGEELPAELARWSTGEVAERRSLRDCPRPAHVARTFVRDRARASRKFDDVVLATSELATNATKHGDAPISVALWTSADAVVVEVADAAFDRLPKVLSTDAWSATGRGMSIVDAIADHWGVTVLADRKIVWAEFTAGSAEADDERTTQGP